MNKTQPTPEEITAVVSEQPDLYQPTVQPLDAVQDNGYFPIEVDAEDKELAAPSLAKLATPSSDRNWLQRFKVAAKTAVSNIMNAQLTHNVALGNKKIIFGKNKEEIEFGRRMASEAKRQIEEVMDGTEELTAEEAESWAAALGGGSVSMVDFAANLALLRGLGAGSVGAQLGAGWLAGRAGYEEGTMSDIDKYIAETGDKELKNYKGDKKAFAVNVVSGAIQGGVEAATSGLGRYLINNPLAKKVLGKTGNDAIRKLASTAVGRTLAAGANESVNNAFEEWTQALTGNIAEIVKGNEEFSMDNILNGAGQAAGVGALLGWVATPVMQEYGRRKTRDWISDKLRKASEEKGIPLTEAEIKDAANDLLGRIESKGVQKVSDNYDKIIQLTDSESDLAQTLSRVFEDLVNQGQIKFRQATPDEIRQAGLDWANWQQALALMDSLEREIPLSAHPLFNAVAEADRIFLEGRDPGTGDLLPLDINNAQVRELANQIEDYIEQNRETRQAEEASKLVALREADMRARQQTIQELERAAIAELEKEQVANNQERITELQQQITELQHQMDLLREERSKYIQERAAQGRVSIKQARAQETKRIAHTKTQNAIGSFNSFESQVVMPMATEAVNSGQVALPQDPTGVGYDASDFASAVSDEISDLRGESVGERYFKKDTPIRQTAREWLASDERAKANFDKAKQLAKTIADAEKAETEQVAQIPDDLQYQDTPFDLAAENARLDEVNPEYTGETINIDGKERTVYNSNGDRIAKSEPALRNFWAWFGDSKVVDNKGRPLVVYHGTDAEFDTFDISKFGQTDSGEFGKGFYFTGSKNYAEEYGSIVMPVYLKITNAYTTQVGSNISEEKTERIKADGYDGIFVLSRPDEYKISNFDSREEYEEAVAEISKSGKYIVETVWKGDDVDEKTYVYSRVEYVAFEPNQIKSTDNKGTFSEDTRNIYYQTAYAGSRVDYDRPSLEAIGSGEGNQAHGWGLYYALDPQIAESYRETFMSDAYDTNWKIDGVPLKEFLGDLYNSETFDYFNNVFNKVQAPTAYEARSNLMTALYDVSRMYSNNYTQGRKSFFSDKVVKNENDLELSHLAEEKRQFVATLHPDDITVDKGQVHEVDIPEMDVFLDEQKTFDEQSEFVKSALDSIDIKNYPNFANAILNGKTGKDIYNSLIIDIDAINEKNDVANAEPDKQASQLLEQYGIKGITYDGRQDGRCFVIFNSDDVKVLRKKFDEFGRVLFQNKKTSKSTTGLGTEHRGGYDPITKAIIFNKTSDLTTLFHESAHYWFDRNLRYYRTGLASPEWKKNWEDVMEALGATPNARGTIPVSVVRSASEKFARSMEAYLREGKYENAAMKWAHQDYANMVKRIYRNIWSTYWGMEELSPAVQKWFDLHGLDVSDATTAFTEEDKIETAESVVGAVIAEDATKPDVDAETKAIVADAGAQVVENPATQEIAVVPADPFETGKKARSKLPRSAEAATGVSMDDIIYNRRSMSDAFKAAQQLVNTDPVRAWEILKGGQEMVDGLYAGDIYRALIAKYQAENNPAMLKNVVQAFAGAARRAGRSVKAFDLESPRISFEKTINSLDKIFDTKKNDKRIEKVKNELKEFLHDPSALRVGWEEFKNIVGCK